jgi:hypothetical protein
MVKKFNTPAFPMASEFPARSGKDLFSKDGSIVTLKLLL